MDPRETNETPAEPPEATFVWQMAPGASPEGPDARANPAPGGGKGRRAALVAGAVVLLLAGVLTAVALSSSPAASGPAAVPSAGTSSLPAQPDPTPESTAPEPAPTPAPRPKTSPPKATSPEDPPARSGQQARITGSSEGDPCVSYGTASDYGSYPAASCTFWKSPRGLLHDELIRASDTPREVACQRNLKRENKRFAEGQTNTWWVWTTSDSGTWDWYPETAIAEGASDQPINGVAVCR